MHRKEIWFVVKSADDSSCFFEFEMLSELANGSEIERILALWYKHSGIPVAVISANMFLLHSEGFDNAAEIPDWINECLRSYSLQGNLKDKIWGNVVSEYTPVEYKDSSSILLAGRISIDTDKIYIFTLLSHSSTDDDKHLFASLLKGLKIYYSSPDVTFDRREQFINDIIDGKLGKDDRIQMRLRRLSLPEKVPITLAVIRGIKHIYKKNEQLLPKVFGQVFPGSCVVRHGQFIAAVIFNRKLTEKVGENLLLAKEKLEEMHLQCCICPPIVDYLDITEMFSNAVRTLEICITQRITDPIVWYDQFIPRIVLSNIPPTELELRIFPLISRLYEYDIANATKYTITLYAYLLCFGSRSEIASLLDITYNTVKQRIEYITSQTDVLSDAFSDIAPALYMSFRMLMMLHMKFASECAVLETKTRSFRR